jgi:hypothetical protein
MATAGPGAGACSIERVKKEGSLCKQEGRAHCRKSTRNSLRSASPTPSNVQLPAASLPHAGCNPQIAQVSQLQPQERVTPDAGRGGSLTLAELILPRFTKSITNYYKCNTRMGSGRSQNVPPALQLFGDAISAALQRGNPQCSMGRWPRSLTLSVRSTKWQLLAPILRASAASMSLQPVKAAAYSTSHRIVFV